MLLSPNNPNPQSGSPQSTPTPTLESLTDQDRQKLSTLFRAQGDAVNFAHLREEDPLETLVWLSQPHIKPWHDAIRAAHREHQATETHLSLARALRDITRILDLEADSTLRIRAVNAIIKLANAIHRASREPHRTPALASSSPSASASVFSSPLEGASDGCRRVAAETQGPRGSASASLVAALQDLQHPSGVREPSDNPSPNLTELASIAEADDEPFAIVRVMRDANTQNLEPTRAFNAAHTLTARAGTPRPTPDNRRSRKRRHR